MLKKTSSIINLVFSLLIMLIGIYGAVTEKEMTEFIIIILVCIFTIFPLCLALDIYCLRLYRLNSLETPAGKKFRVTGFILLSFCILCSLVLLLLVFSSVGAFQELPDNPGSNGALIAWAVTIAIFTICFVTLLLNVIFAFMALKQNKEMLSENILSIGNDLITDKRSSYDQLS